MKRYGLLVLCMLSVLLFIGGCSASPPQTTTPPATLKISEPVTYSFDIKNPSQLFVKKEFSDFSLELRESDKVFIDDSKTNFGVSSIKDGETAKVTMSIISLAVGTFTITGELSYDKNGEKGSIPIEIDSYTPQLGGESKMSLTLKEKGLIFKPSTDFGVPKTLHAIVSKEKDEKYSGGKITITSASYSVLNCVAGYECTKEENDKLNIFTDISRNTEIPFTITVNKPDEITGDVSFTPTMKLWYSKDGSYWGELVEGSFEVKTS